MIAPRFPILRRRARPPTLSPHSKCWTPSSCTKHFSCSKNPGSQARSPKGVRQRFFPHLPPTHNSRCLCSVGAQWGRKAWKGACSPKQDQRRRGRRLRPRLLSPFRVVIQARLQQKKQEQPPEEVPGRQRGRRQGPAKLQHPPPPIASAARPRSRGR